MSVNEPPEDHHRRASRAVIAFDSVVWAVFAFWATGGLLAWMDRSHAAALSADLELALVALVPVAAALTVVACHLGWLRRKPAN